MYDLTALTLCFKLKVFYINICCFINKTEQQVLRTIRSLRTPGVGRLIGVDAFNGANFNLWEPLAVALNLECITLSVAEI